MRRVDRLREGRKTRDLCLPVSITWVIRGTVRDVSAMFVARITLRVFCGEGEKIRDCE